MKIPQIKKILVATDLSPNSRYAFGYAASLANRYGASVTVLYVLEETGSYQDTLVETVLGKDKWEEIKEQNIHKVMDILKDRIEGFCRETSSELPECPFITDEILVQKGHPVEEILKLAHEKDFDLVVMGARGHGIFESAVIGSVSRRVLRGCLKPVLVVRLPEND